MERRLGIGTGAEDAARRGAPKTRAEFIRTCAILRTYVESKKLATAAEIGAAWPPRGKAAALWEWAYCWAQFSRFFERGNRTSVAGQGGNKTDVAALLLARTPVRVRIGGDRIVGVTSRSLAAMEALAAHDRRRREIERELDRCGALLNRTESLAASGAIPKTLAKRQVERLNQAHERAFAEYLYQTRGIIANALTPTGAPATPEEAPDWWVEITSADLVRILGALWEVGPVRYGEMGPQPDPSREGRMEWAEYVGYDSLLEAIAAGRNMAPAALRDVDLFQVLTSVRVSAEQLIEEKRA